MADHEDGEVGRRIIGRIRGKFRAAVRALRPELQISGEDPSLVAAWTAPAESGSEGGEPARVRTDFDGGRRIAVVPTNGHSEPVFLTNVCRVRALVFLSVA